MIIIKDIETELGLSKKVVYQPKEGIYTCYTMDALGYYFIYVPQDDFIVLGEKTPTSLGGR